MAALKPDVLAAGGVILRPASDADIEVLLVHRPGYDDWSLPKGKLKRGEHPVLGALREVAEETSLSVTVGARLPSVEYVVSAGRKRVAYWAMTAADPTGARAAHEIDRVAWFPAAEAVLMLSYDRDRPVVRAALAPARPPVILLSATRHAAPLATVLAAYGPTRLVSATSQRCRETLAPLATRLHRPIEVDPSFDARSGPWIGAQRLRTLDTPTVVCAKEEATDPILRHLLGRAGGGTAWALTFRPGDGPPELDPIDD